MLFWTKIAWPKYIGWARVLFAASALVLTRVYSVDINSIILIILLLYLGYSVVPALRARGMSGLIGLLALFGDTVYFLVLAALPSDRRSTPKSCPL